MGICLMAFVAFFSAVCLSVSHMLTWREQKMGLDFCVPSTPVNSVWSVVVLSKCLIDVTFHVCYSLPCGPQTLSFQKLPALMLKRETRHLSPKLNLCMCACMHVQSCPVVCDAMECTPPGSSVDGIFLARILEWGFPGSSVVKNPPCNARNTGLIPVSGRAHMPWATGPMLCNKRNQCNEKPTHQN